MIYCAICEKAQTNTSALKKHLRKDHTLVLEDKEIPAKKLYYSPYSNRFLDITK